MINFNPIRNINFGAKSVLDVPIFHKDENGTNQPYNANLVEFDVYDPDDEAKIKEICWSEDFESFGRDLYHDLYKDGYWGNVKRKRCYALLENTEKNLSNIDKDKVLGMYSLYECDDSRAPLWIAYFMTNEKYCNHWKRKAEFNAIGHGMDESIKRMHPKEAIAGYSAWHALPFWEKEGYEHLSERRLIYNPKLDKEV